MRSLLRIGDATFVPYTQLLYDRLMPPSDVFVMTLRFDDRTFEILQALRIRHFPPSLNVIPAHLTLFHSLSIEQVDRLQRHWDRFERDADLVIRLTGVRSLGRGVALSVESQELDHVREQAALAMTGEFSRQDLQSFHAHVTIQNKVTPAEAKALLHELKANFVSWQGFGCGLMVWKYLGGPWSLHAVLPFNRK